MTKTEALRLALEALEEYTSVVTSVNDPNTWIKVADGGKPAREAITAIKAALEAKDEPVADHFDCGTYIGSHIGKEIRHSIGDDLPPQRTWVGLTAEEREQVQAESYGKVPHHVALIAAVEVKLKEKNT